MDLAWSVDVPTPKPLGPSTGGRRATRLMVLLYGLSYYEWVPWTLRMLANDALWREAAKLRRERS